MSDIEKIPLEDWRTDIQAAFALQDRLKASKDTYPEQVAANQPPGRLWFERFPPPRGFDFCS
jgi:hypothetical protein